jgi:hypothetical protein
MAPTIQDWRIDLMRSHPRLFEIISGEPERSRGYPLCEAGWRDVLERLCLRIEAALQESETFGFVRIDQKFGVLRVDWHAEVSDETSVRIREALTSRSHDRHAPANSAARMAAPVQLSRRARDAVRRACRRRSRTRRTRQREPPSLPSHSRQTGQGLRPLRPRGDTFTEVPRPTARSEE